MASTSNNNDSHEESMSFECDVDDDLLLQTDDPISYSPGSCSPVTSTPVTFPPRYMHPGPGPRHWYCLRSSTGHWIQWRPRGLTKLCTGEWRSQSLLPFPPSTLIHSYVLSCEWICATLHPFSCKHCICALKQLMIFMRTACQ